MIKVSEYKKPQPEHDELISKNKLIMWIADCQMATNPHTEEGQFEYNILEMVFRHVKEMKGETK